MFKLIRKFNPFYRPRKKTYYRKKTNYNSQLNNLSTDIFNLKQQFNVLAKMTGHKVINNTIMTEKDAKKYEDQHNYPF